MRLQVRPACSEPAVAQGLRGRYINQASTRRCHQGSKARQAFIKKPDIRMHLSLVSSAAPPCLDIPGGSIYEPHDIGTLAARVGVQYRCSGDIECMNLVWSDLAMQAAMRRYAESLSEKWSAW